jgi:hypothetical protein
MFMSYLTPAMANDAISKMKYFHDDIVLLYGEYGMDLLDNLGRRNIVMSQAQEKFFAGALAKYYEGVQNDGRTGLPDIFIGSLNKELECKLTSKHKSGSISFQTDRETLAQKKELDFLYVIADPSFSKFAVLHFIGLTTDEFRPVSPGSRGKVGMYKHKGMKKCNMLHGGAIDINKQELAKIEKRLAEPFRSDAAQKKVLARKEYWVNTPTRYSFTLEEVSVPSA